MLGDKAHYSTAAIRAHVRRRRIRTTTPKPADQARNRLRRGSRGGRPPAFDAAAYKQRNIVERAFSQLRRHLAVATRYNKRDFVWRGTADVASNPDLDPPPRSMIYGTRSTRGRCRSSRGAFWGALRSRWGLVHACLGYRELAFCLLRASAAITGTVREGLRFDSVRAPQVRRVYPSTNPRTSSAAGRGPEFNS